jgi:hypothetical protein
MVGLVLLVLLVLLDPLVLLMVVQLQLMDNLVNN